MTKETIKFALVGCGSIAWKHITALDRLNDAKLVAGCDINPEIAQKFEKKYQLPGYTDIESMIKDTDPDVLNILTPSGMHAKNILECVPFKKDFVVEKPLALRVEEVDKILEECDKSKLKIFVVNQNRFNPPVKLLRTALDKGRFGRLVMGSVRVRWRRDQEYYDQRDWRGTWALDGGVLTNQASHHIDILQWMMGEPESVIAQTATRLAAIEVEDTGAVIIRFRNGALGVVEATTATRPEDLEGSISILGEKGSVEIGGFFMNEIKIWKFEEPDPMDDLVESEHAKVPDLPAWNHTEFFKDVLACIKDGLSGLVDGLEGRKSVELINAIYESAEKGEEVFLRYVPQRCPLGIQP